MVYKISVHANIALVRVREDCRGERGMENSDGLWFEFGGNQPIFRGWSTACTTANQYPSPRTVRSQRSHFASIPFFPFFIRRKEERPLL